MSENAVMVTAHDWIRGILLSVLASMIGGASKLSIRKSWLIDARRRKISTIGERERDGARDGMLDQRPNDDDDDHDDTYHENEGDARQLSPLEVDVASPPSPAAIASSPMNQHSPLLSCGGGGGRGRERRRHRRTVSSMNSQASERYSWLLYVSGMIGMSFLNPLCCVLAMRYANPSILAPFSGLTLVWIVLFSGISVDEHPNRDQKVACGLIVAGEILVALFGDHTSGEDGNMDDVISSYHDPAFRIFIVLMTLYIAQLGIFIWTLPNDSLLKKVAWGSVGGSITGFQNFLKDALTILDVYAKRTGNSPTGLPSAFFLFALLAMLTSFSGLLCLSACMKRYDATYSSAMFVVSFVISASCMSTIHYHTVEHLDGFVNYVMYPLGLMTLFLGAYMLATPMPIVGGPISDDDGGNDSFDESSYPNSSKTCFDERNIGYRRC